MRVMKDSGVEWIGKIPAGWITIKIKHVAFLKGRIGWQGLTSTEYQDEGAYLITGTDFENGFINWQNCVHITEQRYNEDFGYTKIIIERPLLDDNGRPILKNGRKQPDPMRRDSENVPLKEDIDEYFAREVLPFAPDSWIDRNKSKVGYEIPFTRYFYKYEAPKPSHEIMSEIMELDRELAGGLEELFKS